MWLEQEWPADWFAGCRATLRGCGRVAVLRRFRGDRAMGPTTARHALGLKRRARRTRRRDVGLDSNPFPAHRGPRKLCTMLNQPRLDEIVRLLSQQQRVKSIDLATSFGVSEETIRRDFKFLEGQGNLRRVHGGAILPRLNEEQPLQVRNRIKTQAKVALAGCAMQIVQEGM